MPCQRTLPLALPCLLSDEQSLPFDDRDARRQSVFGHATIERGLYPVFQQETTERGTSLSGPVQGNPRSKGEPFPGGLPLRGVKSGQGPLGPRSRRMEVEQLSVHVGSGPAPSVLDSR